jgi:hypothetical protein
VLPATQLWTHSMSTTETTSMKQRCCAAPYGHGRILWRDDGRHLQRSTDVSASAAIAFYSAKAENDLQRPDAAAAATQ